MNEQKQLTPGEMINEWMRANKGQELYLNDATALMEQYADQQTAALREEIELKSENFIKLLDQLQESEAKGIQKDVRIKELEDALELQKCKVKEHHDFCARQDAKRVEQLEAVKKDRDELKLTLTLNETYEGALQDNQMLEDAGNYLKEVLSETNPLTSNCSLSHRLRKNIYNFLSRLSSGETKPEQCDVCSAGTWRLLTNKRGCYVCDKCLAEKHPSEENAKVSLIHACDISLTSLSEISKSPWISVEDRLPEDIKEYDVFLKSGKQGIGIYHPSKHWIAKGYSWDFIAPNDSVTHYKERTTAPPESLTDKTE